jgi:tetratricopeptide (TPR) repeat protein
VGSGFQQLGLKVMELLERYQIMLEKDPRSQVFAPLAEAYRKMGLLEEAFRICVRGVQFHPNFAGGRLAMAKVLMDRENPQGAMVELEKVVELSPDNIMAHQMMGELFLKQKNAKSALRSYKMVLFLAPTNERAQLAVKKLESLTADEFDEDIFAMKPLKEAASLERELDLLSPLAEAQKESQKIGELDRYLSLADAYIVRNDFERASQTLAEAERYYSSSSELMKRMKLLSQRTVAETPLTKPKAAPTAAPTIPQAAAPAPVNRKNEEIDRKIAMLQDLLGRFQAHASI